VAALTSGSTLPRLELSDGRGNAAGRPAGEILYGFFKTTCPTCEFAWPFLDRIGRIAEGGALTVVAVSQDDIRETASWNHRLGIKLLTFFDDEPWAASEALGIESVPTFLRVGKDGRIRDVVAGFQKQKMHDFAAEAAALAGKAAAPFFQPGENVPALKAG
jgi:thiol-disulfide isomerase/thioredoxin